MHISYQHIAIFCASNWLGRAGRSSRAPPHSNSRQQQLAPWLYSTPPGIDLGSGVAYHAPLLLRPKYTDSAVSISGPDLAGNCTPSGGWSTHSGSLNEALNTTAHDSALS